VAVWADGAVRGRASETGGRASHVFGLVDTALKAAAMEREAVECVAVGIGPGSYTGIRSSISVAQGWQLARGIRLLGISSVECLAAQARVLGWLGEIHVVVDAQRSDLYLATYEVSQVAVREVEALRLATQEEAQARVQRGGIVIGPEASRWFPAGREFSPDAAMLAELAAGRSDFADGALLAPIYLRETSFVKAPAARVIPGGKNLKQNL
jgi:tRNA threonylcarbamoyl adenosine modification protein YeaZ